MKPKKIPMRMCVGCREMKPKRELKRIVKSPTDSISIDPTGKAQGRGAYVCKSRECLLKAQKAHLLEKALEHKIEPIVYEKLLVEITAMELATDGTV